MTRLGELTTLALVCLCHQGAYANPTTPIDKVSTCDVPSVPSGKTASLTCDFLEDVARNQSVKVKFYGVDNTEGNIVDCYVNKKEEKYKCDVTHPYSLPADVSGLRIPRHMTLTFTADTNREGNYTCLIEPATNLKECVFKLEDDAPSGDDDKGIIIGIVVGVLVPVLIFGVVIAVKVFRKRNHWSSHHPSTPLPSLCQHIKDALSEVFCCVCRSRKAKPKPTGTKQPLVTPEEPNLDTATKDNPEKAQPRLSGEEQSLLKNGQPYTDESANIDGQAGDNLHARTRNDSGIALSVPSSQTTSAVYAAATTTPQQGSRLGQEIITISPGMLNALKNSDTLKPVYDEFLRLLKQNSFDALSSGTSIQQDKYSSDFEDSNLGPITKGKNGEDARVVKSQGTELRTSSPWFTAPLPLSWPSLDIANLGELKVFIRTKLTPLVTCNEFPRHDQRQAEWELEKMKEVKVDIGVNLKHVRRLSIDHSACSPQVLKDKDSLYRKLEKLEKVSEKRIEVLHRIIEGLMSSGAQARFDTQQMERERVELMRLDSTNSYNEDVQEPSAASETPKGPKVWRVAPTVLQLPGKGVDSDLKKLEQESTPFDNIHVSN